MCIYRYCYFGGCKHQKLVLVRLCDKAKEQNANRALADTGTYTQRRVPNPSPITEEGTPQQEDWKEQTGRDRSSGVGKEEGKKSAGQDAQYDDSPTISASPTIVPDTPPDTQHSSTTSHPTMPLPSFSNDFRHWAERFIAPGGNAAEHKDINNKEISLALPNGSGLTAIKKPGIRNDTDDSCDLPNGSDIIQHLAECSPCDFPGRNGDFEGRCASSGSLNCNLWDTEEADSKLELSLIEADIDYMKEEVTRLRAESNLLRVAQKTDEETQLEDHLETGSNRTPTPHSEPADEANPSIGMDCQVESPAALLKSLHEKAQSNAQPAVPKTKSPPKPKLDDLELFPTLGNTGSMLIAAPTEQGDKRKISWSETCTKGLQDNVKVVSMRTGKKIVHVSQIPPPQPPPVVAQFTGPIVKDMDGRQPDALSKKLKSPKPSTSTSKAKPKEPVVKNNRGTVRHDTTHDKVPKQSNGDGIIPSFAQPTKSFARRAGESALKEIKQNQTKTATPKASVQEIEKFNVKSEQKRPPIPRAWAPLPVAADMKSGQKHQQLSPGQWPSIKDTVRNPNIIEFSPTHDISVSSDQISRKLINYMTSTAAASQRVAETLGSGPAEPKISRERPSLRIDVAKACEYKARSLRNSNDSRLGLRIFTPGPALTPKLAPASPSLSPMDELDASLNENLEQGQYNDDSPNNSNRSYSPSKIPRPSKKLIELPHTETRIHPFNSDFNRSETEARTSEQYPMTRRRTVSTRILQPVLKKLDRSAPLQGGDGSCSIATFEATNATRIDVQQPANDKTMITDTTEHHASNLPKPQKASSLRATAQEFIPMFEPKTPSQVLGLLSWRGDLDRYSQAEWRHIPTAVRHSIQTLREFKRNASPSKTAERRFWGTLMKNEHATDFVKSNPNLTQSDAQGTRMIAQVLSPGRGSVKWALEDSNGKQQPLSFGRAPALSSAEMPALCNGLESPSNSPTSDTISLTTPKSVGPWIIDAGLGREQQQIGWTGGDGKEITFKGYAPFVERDPNSVVSMRAREREGNSPKAWKKHATTCPHSKGAPICQYTRVWPRSRQEWAAMAESVAKPCGHIVVEQAMEAHPLTMPIWGHCDDCVPTTS